MTAKLSGLCALVCALAMAAVTAAQQGRNVAPSEESASSSLLVNTPPSVPSNMPPENVTALRAVSLFAVAAPKPRTFQVHDLVQIIVRETSQAKSSQDLTAKKDNKLDAKVSKWPSFTLQDLLNFRLKGGANENNPEAQLEFTKEFKGQGDYERKDDLTARLSAEIIEVLPNGNLVLEARTSIKTDDEVQSMKATGICRPNDITAANTILSNQIHDLTIEKIHKGELRQANEKGVIAKVLDIIFAF
jgi:flagellar L-ring protein precursor FlgH